MNTQAPSPRGAWLAVAAIDWLSERTGRILAWVSGILVLLVCGDVAMRYLFSYTRAWTQELEWYVFSLIFLLGAAYTLQRDRHVRVDILYQKLSPAGRQWVDILGGLLFLLPFCWVSVRTSWDYTRYAYSIGEASGDPSGLPARYLIKGAVTLGFVLLGLQGLAGILRDGLNLPRRQRLLFALASATALLFLVWLLRSRPALPPTFETLPLLLFGVIFALLLLGYPVAFTLGGLSVIAGAIWLDPVIFNFLPLRYMGTMSNYILIAVPLFVYMGVMLEKSGLAESMLETMALLFGRYRGGLAYAVVLVGALLAASTGIVGATVVTMGLISLPTMLRRGYNVELAGGTIAAAGTLGQIIPPSVVLVLLGSVLNVPVGDLFKAAMVPGLLLVAAYGLLIAAVSLLRPAFVPTMPQAEIDAFRAMRGRELRSQLIAAFLLPLSLIVAVLGSIFAGIASPTEAAGAGALGATLLTVFSPKNRKRLSRAMFSEVMRETTLTTSMVFMILLGATVFSMVFRLLDGDAYLTRFITGAALPPVAFLALVMLIVFVAGFFIDFIEIIFIIVPVVAPVFIKLGMDLTWIGVLLALNLQTSFLTPPFGFSLFYLRGVAPPELTTGRLYRGILPFVLIQLLLLGLVMAFPGLTALR
ncbi:MAG: hypothetical protein OHK0039_25710 [Bacteroidia bacterium]